MRDAPRPGTLATLLKKTQRTIQPTIAGDSMHPSVLKDSTVLVTRTEQLAIRFD